MNDVDKPKDHSNDSDDEDDSWILKEAAEWATTSETNPATTTSNKGIVERESGKSAISKKDALKKKSGKRKAKIEEQQELLSSQPLPLHQSPPPPSSAQQDVYSLHVTQLSYNATEDDIRQHFAQAGCIGIRAIRMVYDFSQKTSTTKSNHPKKQFRGVAFIDLSDEQSYQYALEKLHGSLHLSRKINVRPVKSKVELANIVQHTRTLVSEKIRTEKEKKLLSDNPSDKTTTTSPKKRKQSPSKSKANEIQPSPLKRKRESSTTSSKHTSTQSSSNNPNKLTKQQRNRRAAILLSRRKS